MDGRISGNRSRHKRPRTCARWFAFTGLAASIVIAAHAQPGLAACNLIPQTTKTFDSVVGSTNRPFAAPGEPIEVAVRPCDSASAGLSANAADQVVTVLFTPLAGGMPNAAVLTAGSCGTLGSQLAACAGQLGGGQARCFDPTTGAGVRTVQRPDGPHLQFLFPNTDALIGSVGDALTLAGPATIAVTQASAPTLPCGLATATCRAQAGSIAGLVACVDDFFTSDGACGTSLPQGTFNHFTALPIPNNFAGTCLSDTVGLCSNSIASQVRLTADHDGNALLPMDWSGILVRTGGLPIPRLLSASLSTSPLSPQFTIILPGQSFFASFSPDGGPLAPIFVPQFDTTEPSPALNLFGSADAPYTVLRIARRSDHPAQCQGGAHPGRACNGTDDCPGLCSAGANAGQRCTSNAECPSGACSAPPPGSCGPTVCINGSNAGHACTADSFCPGGECGPGVFTLTPLVFDGNGPVVLPRQPGVCASGVNSGAACVSSAGCPGSFCVAAGFCQENTGQFCSLTTACSSVPCVDFQLTAENPIPLESLAAQTANVFGLTSLETVDLVDRNGDGDKVDAVVTLRNRTTGALQPLGAPAECIGHSTLSASPVPQGRAVVQISQPPFLFPAVATEGDLVAFLESEPTEGGCDENSNGALFDSILRVFRLGPQDLTAGRDETIDAAPVLNAQSVTISNGRVFFRQSEAQRARQQTTRVSVGAAGAQGNGYSTTGALSADGRYVAFGSTSSNLVAGDTNGFFDIFVRDRCISNGRPVPVCTPTTQRVSVNSAGTQGNDDSWPPSISGDGRFVAFLSYATNLVSGDTNGARDVFVRDRCIANGTPVPTCTPTTTRASVDSFGTQGNDISTEPAMSGDGRYVAFSSSATNLVGGDSNAAEDVFVHDLLTGITERVSVDSAGGEANGASAGPALSADGRYVSFYSYADNLVPGDVSGVVDLFVHDRLTGGTERVSVDSFGGEGNANSYGGALSADGRYVAFETAATNLVPGDTNGRDDILVHDRLTGLTERVSVDSVGREVNGLSENPALSADGRYVTFDSQATNLVPGDTNGTADVFVHDRLTGATQRVSVSSSGSQGTGSSFFYSEYGTASSRISASGHDVVFESDAANLVASDTNADRDVFVRGVDVTDTASDVTGDGDLNDMVLAMLDTTQPSHSPVSLCPADAVSAAGGVAAFLRPESAGAAPHLMHCPAGNAAIGGVDLNGNNNAGDDVVHLVLDPSTIQNLGVAATAVSLSGTCAGGANNNFPCVDNADCSGGTCVASLVAALVSEAGQNTDLNNDGDTFDTVVEVQPVGAGVWTDVNQAADTVQVEGTLVAFITPEADQGNTDLNGDHDKADRVLQLFDSSTNATTNTKAAAEEFVMGTQPASCGSGPLVAFRTAEAAQGNRDLNGDGDATDNVLQLYVPGVGLINTHEAVTPCALPACDPRHPYLVQGDTVRFLTYEGDQRQDLNGNGNQTDLILQIFDACTRTLTMVGTVDTTVANVDPLTNGGTMGQSKVAFATTAGVCMSGLTTYLVPAMCSSDADCPTGATCQPGNSIVAAPAVIPTHHDSVVTPHGPLTVVIPLNQSSVAKTLKLKVSNGDVRPVKEKPGHTVQLAVSDGTCPAGTVAAQPDFFAKVPGAQDKVLLKGGAAKSAKVPLLITSSAFATVNHSAPYRCTLAVSVTTANVDDNIDPTPANNSVPVELNVIDQNNLQASSPADAVIKSVSPLKLTIGKHAPTMSTTRTLTLRLLNADSVPASLTATASDGTCPVGTAQVSTPVPVLVAGGASARVKLQVTATNAAFLTANGVARSRCIATVNVASTGTDPDPTNNTVQLIIDVTDKEDF